MRGDRCTLASMLSLGHRGIAVRASLALVATAIVALSVACAPSRGPVRMPATRDAALWPFSVDSPWNTPIGSAATYGDLADGRTAAITAPSLRSYINAGSWSLPVHIAVGSDPVATVSSPSGQFSLRWPRDARPAAPLGGDASLNVIGPNRRTLDEMWEVKGSGRSWTAGHHVTTDLYGSGIGGGGARAYGGSAMGGLIRTWEVIFGFMHHALAMSLPRSLQETGPVWPAALEDVDAATSYGGPIPLGTLFAIPLDVDLFALGLSPQCLLLGLTLQRYGTS